MPAIQIIYATQSVHFPMLSLDRTISFTLDGVDISITQISREILEIIAIFNVDVSQRQYDKLLEVEKIWKPEDIDEISNGSLKELVVPNYHTVREAQIEGYNIIRWRFNFLGPNETFQKPRLYWKCTKDNEIIIPDNHMRPTGIVAMPGFEASDFERVLQTTGASEPVAHAILRDAKWYFNDNPKAALLLAAVALETGTKQFLGRVCPDTDWLLENIQSPPIDRLIFEYMPTKGIDVSKIEKYKKEIKNIITERNNLVHKGETSIEVQDIYESIYIVNSMLYFYDEQSGFKWASEYVR